MYSRKTNICLLQALLKDPAIAQREVVRLKKKLNG
jgi:hypothetical protein